MKTMRDASKAFSKDLDGMQAKLNALNKTRSTLKVDTKSAQNDLRAAEKQFARTGAEADRLALQEKRLTFETARRNLALVDKEARNVERQMQRTGRAFEETAAQSRAASGMKTMIEAVAAASAGTLFGPMLQQGIGTIAGSVWGDVGGGILSSVVSSVASGAMLGNMIAPGVGTAVGAALGGVTGLVSGAVQNYEARDEAFQGYYGGLYDTGKERTAEGIAAGSSIAGGREQAQKAFAHRLGGEEAARDYLEQVKAMAAHTNYTFDEITGYSKKLLNTYDADETFGVLQKLSDATAGLNLSSGDVNMMINGLSRMRTTGKTTQEYLNYFSERGVDVYQALADSTGANKSSIAKMVTKGKISGETAAQAILDYIEKTFGGLSEELMGTYDAMADNLGDVMANVNESYGIGYNETRKSGVEAEQEAYEGALGEAVKQVNQIAGENKAYLENLSEQYTREALGAVLLGERTTLYGEDEAEKLTSMGEAYRENAERYAQTGDRAAAMEMESLREQAEAMATAAYDSSEMVKTLQDVSKEQIEALRDNTAALSGWSNAFELQQAKTKGQLGGAWDPGAVDRAFSGANSPYRVRGYATGLGRVPYDNFPALLHEGERVLTAGEARGQSAAAPIQITVQELAVREEADVDRVAAELLARIQLARMGG